MSDFLQKITKGYRSFRSKFAVGDASVMQQLALHGQKPQGLVVTCSDSRVDPAILTQSNPGDLFVVRNVANIIPSNNANSGPVASALEYGLCYLNIPNLIILGHSQCGGVSAALCPEKLHQDDFISQWVSNITVTPNCEHVDSLAKAGLLQSYQNCLTYPWLAERITKGSLSLYIWFFDIGPGEIHQYCFDEKKYLKLVEPDNN